MVTKARSPIGKLVKQGPVSKEIAHNLYPRLVANHAKQGINYSEPVSPGVIMLQLSRHKIQC